MGSIGFGKRRGVTHGAVLALTLVIAAFVVAAVWGGDPARVATDMAVTETEDEVSEDGDCSLREAILAANDD